MLAGVLVVVALTFCGGLAGPRSHPRAGNTPGRRLRLASYHTKAQTTSLAVSVPGAYLALGQGVDDRPIELVSATSGRVYPTAAVAHDPTGDHAVLTQKGRDLVYSSDDGLTQVALSSGASSILAASGRQPALSSDGRALAYMSGGRVSTLAVRSLATGRTRTVTGLNSTIFDPSSTPVWLDDGRDIAIVGQGCVTRFSSTTCITVVHLGPGHVTTHDFQLAIPSYTQGFAAARDTAHPESMIFATGAANLTSVYRITFAATSASFAKLGSIGDALPEALGPSGRQLLVRTDHGDQELVTIAANRLLSHRRLAEGAPSPYAW